MSAPALGRGRLAQAGDGGARYAAPWPAALGVFLSFLVDSFARYPIPAPNEPHYLAKARHFWMPGWCPNDLFLSSSNAHLVFYETFGLLTRWFSFEAAAVLGRLIGLLILAAGWTALVRAVVPGRWTALWAAWIFLGLAAIGNLSGEWLVGGIEGKVVAYGLLFAAAAVWIDHRPGRPGAVFVAWSLFGLAVAFHPVVGLWGLAAALFGSIVRRLATRPAGDVAWVAHGLAVALAAALAAPGIIAGLRAASGSSLEADYIQVYYRLAHHLDPMAFSAASHFWESPWFGYGILLVAWLLGRRRIERSDAEKWFFWFVAASGLIAACGLVVGWRHGPPENVRNYLFPWGWLTIAVRWKILKLYPFRLYDALLPMAVAVVAAGLAQRFLQRTGRRLAFACAWALCGAPALAAVLHAAPDAGPQMSASQLADWLDACRWIKSHTPPDALVLTPPSSSWAFKWYAQRAEFVSFKDCPQDGPGIVEWNDRLVRLQDWVDQNLKKGFGPAETKWLGDLGVTWIVQPITEPFMLPTAYENKTYRIYPLQYGTVQNRLGGISAQNPRRGRSEPLD